MFVFSYCAEAQQENKFVVGINPFAPIGLTNVPRVEVFGEYFFKQNSLAIDLGLGNFMGNYDSTLIKKIGYRTALSYKHYFFRRKPGFADPVNKFYCGVNLFYWHQQWTEIISVTRADSTTGYNDAYGISRTSYGINAIIGYQLMAAPHLYLDFYIGIGYKKLAIGNTNREFNPAIREFLSRADCGIYPCVGTFEEDAYSRINTTCGIRIGYAFLKKNPAK